MERRRPRQPPTRPLVLLADGHEDTRELYATALRALGFETTIADDGAHAYAKAWQTHPDVIVTEVFLPQLDGWGFIRDTKRDPRTRDIPIVIVTSQPASRERAHHEGCAAFLVKPCAPDDLASTLREVLHLHTVYDDPAPAH